MSLFDEILSSRGLEGKVRDAFLSPSYDAKHDPFLLPDMQKAVDRLEFALKSKQKVVIYGDYDIDGLTATSLLLDALGSFGFKDLDAFIPSRFIDGYGLSKAAITKLANSGADLIITVDCGSLSHKEIELAGSLGVDVIVTDHHSVAEIMPSAIAVINPKRSDHSYPFKDLAGVGVAFKLVQALQTVLPGLEDGQEKWLLDLVALGTVCDVVELLDENRANVYWGLKVLAKTRRVGLKALMEAAGVNVSNLTARTLGFVLGPRLNASGRLETAKHSLDLMTTTDINQAKQIALKLDDMNKDRRKQQDKIFAEAVSQADKFSKDPVLVLSAAGWNHGIIGIVAAKIMEKYKKPTFIIEEIGEEAKGSARSYGDFSAVEAINFAKDLLIKGGGHKLAAGITIETKNIGAFRRKVNQFYKSLNLKNQAEMLESKEDAEASLNDVTEDLITKIALLEPFGNGNFEPILKSESLTVAGLRKMGDNGQHVKLRLQDGYGVSLEMLAFNAPDHFFLDLGAQVDVWYQPILNEWRDKKTVEGRLLNIRVIQDS